MIRVGLADRDFMTLSKCRNSHRNLRTIHMRRRIMLFTSLTCLSNIKITTEAEPT